MNIITNILIKIIKGYKFIISPLFGHSCRYLPTCSEYSIEALKEFGLAKGTLMSLKRIIWEVIPLKEKKRREPPPLQPSCGEEGSVRLYSEERDRLC